MARTRENRVKAIQGRNIQTIMDSALIALSKVLSKRAGHFPEVIEETGLSRELISKLHNKQAPNPTLETTIRVLEACGYKLVIRKKDENKFKNTVKRNRKPDKANDRRVDSMPAS